MKNIKKKAPTISRFMLYDEKEMKKAPPGGTRVLLYPFRNLSLQEFTFPFAGLSKVRDAIKIRLKPLLGSSSDDVSVIPFFVNAGKKTSHGSACILFGGETGDAEESIFGGDKNYLVWPAVLAFAGETGGSGIVIWVDDDSVTSVWIDEWTPLFYKFADISLSTPEQEEEFMSAYVSGQGKTADKVIRRFRRDTSDEEIQLCGAQTLELCPAYEKLDLSGKGTNLLEARERTVSTLTGAGRALLMSGSIFLLLVLGLYLQKSSLADESGLLPGDLYKTSFGEASHQPMSSAKAKLNAIQDPQKETTLTQTMADITKIWDNIGKSDDIYIDLMKYSAEKTDVIGTAKNSEAIQRLRGQLEKHDYSVKTDNIQKIQSGELRFNMTITRKGRTK